MANVFQFGTPKSQKSEGSSNVPEEKELELINGQIIATIVGIIAAFIAFSALLSLKERLEKECPDKDYSYVRDMFITNLFLVMGVSLYFLYAAFIEFDSNPQAKDLKLVFVSNAIIVLAVAIKLYVVFAVQNPKEEEQLAADTEFAL